MNKLLTYLLIFLSFACSDKERDSEKNQNVKQDETFEKKDVIETTLATKKSDALFIEPSNFKYSELTEFDLREWYYGKIVDSLMSFSSKIELIKYFQNDRINGEYIYPVNYQYFSIQKNEKTEKIITIIEGDESCCHDLHYLIFNSENELISDNIVAGTGGDGMWGYDQYGRFINDSTYVLTRIDMEEIELDSGGTETHIDSVISHFRFYSDKPFEKLNEQKFKKVETY
tara:strand:- start:72 stop:758 length:687 start_codon:yes stop_codon:yes gene_type:complete